MERSVLSVRVEAQGIGVKAAMARLLVGFDWSLSIVQARIHLLSVQPRRTHGKVGAKVFAFAHADPLAGQVCFFWQVQLLTTETHTKEITRIKMFNHFFELKNLHK